MRYIDLEPGDMVHEAGVSDTYVYFVVANDVENLVLFYVMQNSPFCIIQFFYQDNQPSPGEIIEVFKP